MSARYITSPADKPAVIMTIKIGNTSLIPKTAINMPTVIKSVCQNLLMVESTFALIMALSKLNVTSTSTSTSARNNADGPLSQPTASKLKRVMKPVIKKIRNGWLEWSTCFTSFTIS